MSSDHWQDYHRAWSRLTSPLRPHQEVVSAVKQQIAGLSGRAILLGITPELADVAPDLIAVDRNFPLVVNIWPGNTAARKAIVGDWRNPNFLPGSFSACIGDGSLAAVRFPQDVSLLLRELVRILRGGGRFVCRLYLPSETPESVSMLKDAVMAGVIHNFHAFKLRLAMALAAQRPDPHIDVDAILTAFNNQFPDRSELVRMTGWSREQIDTIDFYKRSAALYGFPTRDQLFSVVSKVFPNARLIPAGTYELAERCPLLVADRM